MIAPHPTLQRGYAKFWTFVLDHLAGANIGLFLNRKPSSAGWMTTGTGISGVYYAIAVSRREGWAKVEILIQRPDAESRWLLDRLREWRSTIEADFGNSLEWVDNRALEVQRCRIAHSEQFDVEDSEKWRQVADWFIASVPRIQRALHGPILRFGKLIPPGLETI